MVFSASAWAMSPEEILQNINTQRQKFFLPPYTLNSQLSQAAAAKAQDMITKNYWSHLSPQGTTPWSFILKSGYSYQSAGENLADGYTHAPALIQAWLDSPGHRRNLLNSNYRQIGVAIVEAEFQGRSTTLVVLMLASPSKWQSSSTKFLSHSISDLLPPQQIGRQAPLQLFVPA